jgi:hypothetical protein
VEDEGKQKCKHLPCACEASIGELFCSEACQTADSQPPPADAQCMCGHKNCSDETISLETAEALRIASAALGTA